MNTFFWVLIIVGSLFLLSNLGKVKASKKQMNRDNRINRFGRRQKKPQGRPTIIEGEAEEIKNDKTKIDDQIITEVLKVNGVRFSFEDGSWGLIRASSNKPSLVVVTESPTSDDRKKKIFDFIDDLLQKTRRVGEYDQKI